VGRFVRSLYWQRFAPWLAWLALVLVLELPVLALNWRLRPTGDVLVIATGLLLCARLPRARRSGLALCGVAAVLFWLHGVHRLGFKQAFGDEPLLYDQLYMARHLFVLFGDVWNAWVAAGLVALIAVLWTVARGVRVLARVALRLSEPERWRTTVRVLAALALAYAAGSALPVGAKASRRWVRWSTPAFARNVDRSVGMYERVERDIARSPYRRYRSLVLSRRPDIYLVLVESYGRVMVEHPKMQAAWLAQARHMESTLGAAGWTAVSAFTAAPVLGGRSWLAEATVLMGARVRYEAVFRQLIAQIERVPTLHSLLRAQGYRRVLLAPADRPRPGVEAVDYYGYDHSVGFAELRYRGTPFGWGIVPDQYSLGFLAKHVLPRVPQPRFVDFHMVSSHAPWRELPPLVDDFETLNQAHGATFVERAETRVQRRLGRYLHGERHTYMGTLSDDVALRYRHAILYDLSVLERHLATLKDDALVILLGDHQPPFISTETASFDTPVHVLARDPELLRELSAQGFVPGLRLQPGQPAALRHEGLFSLLARSLARCSGLPEARWPKYRDRGARLGD
jgi:hypothetical protein